MKSVHYNKNSLPAKWQHSQSQLAHPNEPTNFNLRTSRKEQVASDKICNLREILANISSLTDYMELPCSVNVETSSGEAIYVSIDGMWLHNALSKIVLNAVKHNNGKSTLDILIKVTISTDFVTLNITDTGRGISDRVAKKLNCEAKLHQVSVYSQYRRLTPDSLDAIQAKVMNEGGNFSILRLSDVGNTIHIKLPRLNMTLNESIERSNSTTPALIKTLNANPKLPSVLYIANKFDQQKLASLEHICNLTLASSLASVVTGKDESYESVIVELDKTTYGNQIDQQWLQMGQRFNNNQLLFFTSQADVFGRVAKDAAKSHAKVLFINKGDADLLSKKLLKTLGKCLSSDSVSEQNAHYGLREKVHDYGFSQIASRDIQADDFEHQFYGQLELGYEQEKLTRECVADAMHIHEKTLSRRLEEHFAAGFSELLRTFRLNKAKQEIVDGSSITAAAYSCGFSGPSYFARCFRREYGCSPSEYLTKTC